MERRLAGFALVAAGGFVGATSRHGLTIVVGDVTGTFLVNVFGAFILGLLITRISRPETQLFVATGALSSFTTYSTFAADTVALGPTAGAIYVASSYAVGILAGVLGLVVGRRRR